MIHARQKVRRGLTAQVPSRFRVPNGRGTGIGVLAALALSLASAGCGDDGIRPDATRIGQLGSIRLVLEAPLRLGIGKLQQTLEWESRGPWTLREAISYGGVIGDEDVRRVPGDPSLYAEAYYRWIIKVNDEQALKLFIPELSPDTVPSCGPTRTRITLTIRDDARHEQTTWIRCTDGSLGNLTPTGAGPEPAASRVVQAAILARDYTLGEKFSSTYAGSVPFATLDRGVDLSTADRVPTTFTDSAAFRSFWGQAAGGRALPTVDFSREMVILGVVGKREEAGDSVEVRRILPVDQGTLIEVWERVPGDFCTPAALTHVPYHVVLAPLTPLPLRFSDIRVERIPCGG